MRWIIVQVLVLSCCSRLANRITGIADFRPLLLIDLFSAELTLHLVAITFYYCVR